MAQEPRPESRIRELEGQMATQGARIRELSDDSAEEQRAIRQDIKQLDEGMRASFFKIGDTLIAIEESLETAKANMATKEDVSKLETRLDKIEREHGELLREILSRLPEK